MTRWIRQHLSAGELHAHRAGETIAGGRTKVQQWEVVALGDYGPALLLDGCVQSARGDEACYHEALHLPAQMAHPHARRVLLIGGANGGSLPRVRLLPDLQHVTLIDVDRELHETSRRLLAPMHGDSLEDGRLRLVFGEPDVEAAALAEAGDSFDLIIADTPDATADSYSARLFALERIDVLARLLAPDGLFVTQAGQAHPLACRFAARVRKTLEAVFPHVALYAHHVPSFGVPWCFAIAGRGRGDIAGLDPADIDRRLLDLPRDALKAYDGSTHRHMFALPRVLREALTAEAGRARPITLGDPEHVVVA